MRVIAGKNRGQKLAALADDAIRPTSDRVKEAVFSMLTPYLDADATVLDLFGGSGALAIEALSRGVRRAQIVDASAASCKIIRQNLVSTGNGEAAVLTECDAIRFLKETNETYSIIFLDPPYAKGLLSRALNEIARRRILAHNGIIMAERSYLEEAPEAPGLTALKERRYGHTIITLFCYDTKE